MSHIDDENEYYRFNHCYKNRRTNKLSSKYIKNELSNYDYFRVYGKYENKYFIFLCTVICNFFNDETVDTCYIFYIDEESRVNINSLEIFENFTKITKINYININDIVNKLITNKILDFKIQQPYGESIRYWYRVYFDNCIIIMEKSFLLYDRYFLKMEKLPSLLKSDLLEFSNSYLDINLLNKDKFCEFLSDMFFDSDPQKINQSILTLTPSKFNNIKVMYNNYNKYKIPSDYDIKIFEELSELDKVLKAKPFIKQKTIQLKGVRFNLTNRIRISTAIGGLTPISRIKKQLKDYILTTCNITSIKNEIETLILSGE